MRTHITRHQAGTETYADRSAHNIKGESVLHTHDTIVGPQGQAHRAAWCANLGAHKREIVCSGLGFLAGVVFWHLVGFWAFVSGVVFNVEAADVVAANTVKTTTPATTAPAATRAASDTLTDADRNGFARRISRTIEAVREAPAADRAPQHDATNANANRKPDTTDRYAMLETGSITKADEDCAVLALDRRTGVIRTAACIGDGSMFATNPNSVRGDLATTKKARENKTSTDESWAHVNFAPNISLQVSD